MWYAEFLRVRRTTVIYALVTLVVVALITLARLGYSSHSGIHLEGETPAVGVTDLGVVAGFFTLFAAFSCGLVMALLNDGHLAFAWTKPMGRERLALSLVAVDALAIVADFAIVYFVSICAALAINGHLFDLVTLGPRILAGVAFVAFPLSWYGLIMALTASVHHRAAYSGIPIFTGMASVTLCVLGFIPLPDVYHRLFIALNVFNPLAYMVSYHAHGSTVDLVGLPNGSPLEFVAWFAIAAAGVAIAIVQWRRIEA